MKAANLFGVLLSCITLTLVGCLDEQANSLSLTSGESTSVVSAPTTDKEDHLVTVYKSPTCGCCVLWVEHLADAGFHPLVKHPDNLDSIKHQFNITPEYQSCHTATHNDFVFEGHIPVKFIQQFLDNPPAGAMGLAVPGMPLGSPGMEVEQRFTPYTIYQLNKDGDPTVYTMVSSMQEQY